MDETFEKMSRIAAKHNHLEGDITAGSLKSEKDEIIGLGFKPIEQDEDLTPLMLTMMTALEQFKAYVPRCVAIGKANEDDKSFETRYFIPREYQLDHSATIKDAINGTKAIVKRIAPSSESSVIYNTDSISINFRSL